MLSPDLLGFEFVGGLFTMTVTLGAAVDHTRFRTLESCELRAANPSELPDILSCLLDLPAIQAHVISVHPDSRCLPQVGLVCSEP